jgi:hypothetical protein
MVQCKVFFQVRVIPNKWISFQYPLTHVCDSKDKLCMDNFIVFTKNNSRPLGKQMYPLLTDVSSSYRCILFLQMDPLLTDVSSSYRCILFLQMCPLLTDVSSSYSCTTAPSCNGFWSYFFTTCFSLLTSLSYKRMPSSRTLCRVVLVRTDVSEEHIASIHKVTRISELGK